jgi:fatty acid desaturase
MTTVLEDTSEGVMIRAQVRGLGRDARDMTILSRPLVAYNFAYLALVWIVALGAIAVFWLHPAWYTFAIAFLVVSSRQQALLNTEHECIHRKFVPSRRWNERIGRWLCAAPVGSPFGASRNRHLAHHRLLGTDEDPDHELHAAERQRTRRGLLRHFVGGLLGGYAGMVLMGPPNRAASPDASTRRRDLGSLVVAQGVLAGGLSLAFDWWVYPSLWLVPLATVTVLGHLVRSFVEHAITDAEVAEHDNRLITVRSNRLERFLVAPYGMNYHAEHHILPSVPAPRLRSLQKRLAARNDVPPVLERRSYREAIRSYMRALSD